jgi:hydrogenase expression/formation protein HypE
LNDTAALHTLVAGCRTSPAIHYLRDPTQGVATSGKSRQAAGGMVIDEQRSVRRRQGACEILGLDPLYVANEGNCWLSSPDSAAAVLRKMRGIQGGTPKSSAKSSVITRDGADENRHRQYAVVDVLFGEQLPRIC